MFCHLFKFLPVYHLAANKGKDTERVRVE